MAININNKTELSVAPSVTAVKPESYEEHRSAARVEKPESADGNDSDVLSVSASFQAKIKSLDQLKEQPPKEENIVIDGELQRMSDMLARMKALSIQAKSISVSEGQKDLISHEFAQLKNEIQRYSNATRQKGVSIPYDPSQDSNTLSETSSTSASAWVQDAVLEDQQSVDAAIDTLDSTIEQVSSRSRLLTGIQDRLSSAFIALASHSPRSSGTAPPIRDQDQALKASQQIQAEISHNPLEAYPSQTQLSAKRALQLLG